MVSRYLFFTALFSLLFGSSVSWGQDEPESDDTAAETEEYSSVVVGSRHEEAIFDSARSAGLVNSDTMAERPANTIGDLLDEEPGVHTQSTNRGSGAPIIRGQVGPGNLIVFDGVRFNNGTFRTGPNQYLNLFDPNVLDRIEVLRGSGSALYGSDALGGVIHLVPRGFFFGQGWTGGGRATFQSADTSFTAAPEFGWSDNQWSVLVGGSASFFGELNTPTGVVPASEYQQRSAHLRLAYLPQPETELSLNTFGLQIVDAGRVDRLDNSNFRAYDNDNLLTYLRMNHLGSGAFEEVNATLSVNFQGEHVDRHDCATSDVHGFEDEEGESINTTTDPEGCLAQQFDAIRRLRVLDDEVITLGTSLSVLSRTPAEALTFTWGLDAYHALIDSSQTNYNKPDEVDPSDPEALEADPQDRGNFSDGSDYSRLGAFVRSNYEISVGEEWVLKPTLGGRLDYTRAAAPDVPGLGDVGYQFVAFSGDARLAFTDRSQMTYFAGWSQGFRAPNLQETTLLGDTGNFFEIPNNELGPEKSDDFEVGARIRYSAVELQVAGFYTLIDDLITREEATLDGQSQIDGAEVRRRVNADEAVYAGVEAGLRFNLPAGFSLRGNTTWIQGDVTSEGETAPARRVPPLRWMGAVRWQSERYRLFADFVINGAAAQDRLSNGDEDDLRICGSSEFPGLLQSEVGEACTGTDGWFDLGLRIGYDIADHTALRLSLSNLANSQYRLHASGTDAPGFNVAFSVESGF